MSASQVSKESDASNYRRILNLRKERASIEIENIGDEEDVKLQRPQVSTHTCFYNQGDQPMVDAYAENVGQATLSAGLRKPISTQNLHKKKVGVFSTGIRKSDLQTRMPPI